MKNAVFALVALALLLGSVPAAPAVEAAPYRYTDRDANGWPRWIGRVDSLYETYKLRPTMQAKYLPLSLIKTGGFEKMVQEVKGTSNVDTTKWPSWIGELISQ